MVRVDDLRLPSDPDDTNAFLLAAAYQEIELSNRTYVMNGQINVKAGQTWRLNGATIQHTDPSKVMFSAVGVDGWSIEGPGLLLGTLTTRGSAAETGIYVSGCNRYRVRGVTARCFLGYGFHIAPGTAAGFKGDQGQWSDCSVLESMVGLLIENGSGAEYNVFTNFNAVGNIIGIQCYAGNITIIGGNVTENADYGIVLGAGSNNGHGIFSGLNINHNPGYSIKADGITNGFTFDACHIYGDNPGSGWIWLANGSQDVAFHGCVIDTKIQHDSAGTNRAFNTKVYSNYSVGGSNPSGWVAAGTF